MDLDDANARAPGAERIVYGCMGLLDQARAEAAIEAALAIGITRFDHADIYGRGDAESVFGRVLRHHPGLRERITLQSKVGIRLADPATGSGQAYDLSGSAIRDGVRGSLERLGTDRLDVLLLHRPDPLAEPVEIAETIAELQADGLVGGVGVSNCSATQVDHLTAEWATPVVANQLEMSLARHGFVDSAVTVNHPEASGVDFPHGTLEHARLHGIEVQAWGALASGRYTGRAETPTEQATAALVGRLAERQGFTPEAIVLGWLMRHPARITPVIGTTDPDRITACGPAGAAAAAMTREEWYALYLAARGRPIP